MIDINISEPNTTTGALQFNVQGSEVSGIKSLAQRVLIVMLTKMSETLRMAEGSSLIGSLGSTTVDSARAPLLIIGAIDRTQRIFDEDMDSPDDERLASLSAESVSIDGDSVTFTLYVVSRSGESTEITSSIGV